MSVLRQAAGRWSEGHLALFLEPRAQNAPGERARQLLGPAVRLGRKLALFLSTHPYRGLRLGPGLSQDLGSLLRMGAGRPSTSSAPTLGFCPRVSWTRGPGLWALVRRGRTQIMGWVGLPWPVASESQGLAGPRPVSEPDSSCFGDERLVSVMAAAPPRPGEGGPFHIAHPRSTVRTPQVGRPRLTGGS